jgi:manganese-dependent inorganic pyrophosphatase
MGVDSMGKSMKQGDVVVVGDRPEAQRRAIDLGAGVLVISNGSRPEDEVCDGRGARDDRGALAARLLRDQPPDTDLRSLLGGDEREPAHRPPDDLITEITEQVMEVHYRAAIAVDGDRVPAGVVTRTNLLNPKPRRVLLVDHAEVGQSVKGVEKAEVVEILDHHHVGDIETASPIPATFDPVGSTATLVVERFKTAGLRPEESTAKMLLAAILSDTVILNSPPPPTATAR